MDEHKQTLLKTTFCRDCILQVAPETGMRVLIEQCLGAMAAARKIHETCAARFAELLHEEPTIFWHSHGESAALLLANTTEMHDCAGAVALGVRNLKSETLRVRVHAIFLLVTPFEKHAEAAEIVKQLGRLLEGSTAGQILSHARDGNADQFFRCIERTV